MVGRYNNRRREWASSTCSQKIDPQVNVTTQNVKYPDKIVMVISAPIGSNKFYMANGKDIWVKVGADKRRAKREEIRDYCHANLIFRRNIESCEY